MEVNENVYYTKDHEWISAKTGNARVGVSSYAIEQLGDIVHIELPEVGDSFNKGDSFGTIESTKTVSDIYLPAKGKVTNINKELLNNPESIQEDPYKNGWLIEIELSEEIKNDLLDKNSYVKFLEEES